MRLISENEKTNHSIESVEMKVFFGVNKMRLKLNLINKQMQSINQH